MNSSDKEELNALVVGFLTSALNSNPTGFELRQFEKLFPERTEEPLDWYKRYGMPNALEAIKKLGDSIRVTPRGSYTYISLNTHSDKVDKHLVDLVQNQKASGKRKRAPVRSQAQRAIDSFAINRRTSSYTRHGLDHRFQSRLNHDSSYLRSQNQFIEKSVAPPSAPRPTIYKEQSARFAPGDPRARQAASQVRPMPPPSQPFSTTGPPPTKQSTTNYSSKKQPAPVPKQPIPSSRMSTVPAALQPRESRPPARSERDREIDAKIQRERDTVKGRILFLLHHKLPEIKTMYLPHYYEKEWEESIDLAALGFKSLTELLSSFSDSIKLTYKLSTPVISARIGNQKSGDVTLEERNSRPSNDFSASRNAADNSNGAFSNNDANGNKENYMPLGRAKYNAIDAFNVTTMLQSLKPLEEISEPPLGKNKLEDIVKYRTLRIIFKDPQMTLKLDDWERKYQQEWNCSNRIRIRDYGYKTMLEFFKSLTTDLPIKIRLKDDEWIATCTMDTLSVWLSEQVSKGHYRAATVIDAKYEHIAFPGDKYSYLDFETLQKQSYYPSIKTAVRSAYKMCLQMGVQERIEDNITFETCSTCYDDYKRKQYFIIPQGFLVSGLPCVAFDESEQRWCRAILTESTVHPTRAPVSAFLVDYAMTRSFKLENLLCILKNHLKFPVNPVQIQQASK